jgi:DNA-binding transcriptional LysR family regulator
MLDVRRLRVLCAVADHPSLSAAAQALSYTPSAVSQSIVALERQLGVRLLHRGPKGVRLTSTGALLVEQARPILDGLQAAEASVKALGEEVGAGTLHLASFATAGATILPRAIADFRERHPEVALTLTQADPEEAMVRLRAGTVDLIITAETEVGVHGNTEVVHLMDDPLCAVLPAGHSLAARETIHLAELASETWVDTRSGSESRALLLRVCGAAGFIPRVAFESDEYATVAELVAAGVGVALIPGLGLSTTPAGVVTVPLAGEKVVRHVNAALHAAKYRSPAAGAMLSCLQAVAAARTA